MTTDPHFGGRLPVMGETSQEVGAMPKEIIKHERFDARPTLDGGRFPANPIQVEVGWMRNLASVQVGVVKVPEGDHVPRADDRSGFFCDLDRDGINRLIRALRKARDAAFGSDA